LRSFWLRMFGPYFRTGLLFLLAFVSRRVVKADHWLYMKPAETFNTWGTIFQAAYITIMLSVIQPFRCFPHPNGLESVTVSTSILCTEGLHDSMIVFSILGLLPLLCFLIFYFFQVVRLPVESLKKAEFSRPVKFVVYRFQSGAWYWGAFFLLRNFLFALGTLIDPSKPFKQTIFLVTVLVIFTCVQVAVWPWRKNLLNYVDAIQTSCVIVILCSAAVLIGKVDQETRDIAGLVILINYVLAVVVIVVFMAWVVVEWSLERNNDGYRAQKQAKEDEIVATLYLEFDHIAQTLQKIKAQENSSIIRDFVENITEIDVNRVLRTMHMLRIELVQCPEDVTIAATNRASIAVKRVRSHCALSLPVTTGVTTPESVNLEYSTKDEA
jgi:hypothetical protein